MFGLALVERTGRLERGELVSMAGARIQPRPLRFDECCGDVDLIDVHESGTLEEIRLRRARRDRARTRATSEPPFRR